MNRNSIIELIEERFTSSAIEADQHADYLILSNIPRMVVVRGKSQVALAFAHKLRQEFPNRSVFWINARNQVVFEHDLLRIGRCAQLSGAIDSTLQHTCDVTAYLESGACGEWLLIIDSLDLQAFDDPHIFDELIPKSNFGSILLTSHSESTADKFGCSQEIVTLDAWDMLDATRLLELQTGAAIPKDGRTAELLSDLGCLPLAVVQAGSFIKRSSVSIPQYVQLLKGHEYCKAKGSSDHLSAEHVCTANPTQSEIVVLQTILLIKAISDQNAIAEEILYLTACLEPTMIQRKLLRTSYNQSQVDVAIDLLKAYSLVTVEDTGNVLSLHSLIHLAIKIHLRTRNLFATYAERCFLSVSDHFTTTNKSGSIAFENNHQYLPHAISAWRSYMTELTENSSYLVGEEVAEHLASNIVWHLRSIGSYTTARRFAEEAAQCSRVVYGHRSSCFLACLRNVAIVDREMGNFEEVAKILLNTVGLGESFLSRGLPENISLQGEVGLWLQSQGLYQKAEVWHLKAIELSGKHFGFEHTVSLEEGQNYALSLYRQGKLEAARDCFEGILNVRKEQFRHYDADTLDTIDNLALVLKAQGQWELAKEYLRKALDGRKATLGAIHSDTFYSKAELAESHRRCGELPQAERLIKEALEFFRTVLGHTHPTTLILLGNLGILYQCRGHYREAERITNEVVYRRGWKLGPNHPATLLSMFDLSVLLQCQRRDKDALDLGRKVLAARRRTMPRDHPDLRASERHVPQLQENLDCLLRCSQK
ncbi:MAG: hypothetical protein Q9227_004745 [Pyrenula ochraceoflavens]